MILKKTKLNQKIFTSKATEKKTSLIGIPGFNRININSNYSETLIKY